MAKAVNVVQLSQKVGKSSDLVLSLGQTLHQAIQDMRAIDEAKAQEKDDLRRVRLCARGEGAQKQIDVLMDTIAVLQTQSLEGALIQLRVLSAMAHWDEEIYEGRYRYLKECLIESVTAALEDHLDIDRLQFGGDYFPTREEGPFKAVI